MLHKTTLVFAFFALPALALAQGQTRQPLGAAYVSWVGCVKSKAQQNYPAKRASEAVLAAFDACTPQENAVKSAIPAGGLPLQGKKGEPVGNLDPATTIEMFRMDIASLLVIALQNPDLDLLSRIPSAK